MAVEVKFVVKQDTQIMLWLYWKEKEAIENIQKYHVYNSVHLKLVFYM